MNDRERFLQTMSFGQPDRVPNHELGLWGHTVERFIAEGMPPDAVPRSMFFGNDYFGLDGRDFVPVNVGPLPAFEQETVEETDRYIIYRDPRGILRKALKEGTVRGTRPSMDQYLKFPVENPADFEKMKRRHNPGSLGRYPNDWDERVERWQNRDYPLCLLLNATFGFYSTPRRWMGTENLSYAWYDQPKMMHEMLDFLAEFLLRTVDRALETLDIDYFNFFEDMAFKNGPLVSPSTFREFILPRYQRVIERLRARGVKFITVDSDGNIEPLIPLFIEAGVDGIWPCEIAAEMDPLRLRREYGRDLVLSGGIDKRELAKSKTEIEAEVLGKVPQLLEQGGYIPTVDHTVPPDVSLENFKYYMDLKRKVLEGKVGA